MTADSPPARITEGPHPWVGLGGAMALILVCAALAHTARLEASARRADWPPEADLMYLPSSSVLRWLSLGHTELAADLVAARANVYYGTQVIAKAPQRWLHTYIHRAIDLDPRFKRLYASGAAMLVYSGAAFTVEGVENANGVLTRGLAAFPFDWNLLFQLGFNRFFELPGLAGPDDPRVAGWRQQGLESLQQAALDDQAPYWLPNLVARLLTRQGSEELAIRHLEQAYASASNEQTRQQIRAKLMTLKSQQLGQLMEKQRLDFEADLANAYPYAPEGFSVATGPRASGAVDLKALIEGLSTPDEAPGTPAPPPSLP